MLLIEGLFISVIFCPLYEVPHHSLAYFIHAMLQNVQLPAVPRAQRYACRLDEGTTPSNNRPPKKCPEFRGPGSVPGTCMCNDRR